MGLWEMGQTRSTSEICDLWALTQHLRLDLPAFNQDSQKMWNILILQNTGKNFELVGSRCPLQCAVLDHGVIAGNCSLFILPIRNQTSSGTSWKFEWIYISLHCFQSQTYNCFQQRPPKPPWAIWHLQTLSDMWDFLSWVAPNTNSLGTAGFQVDTP